MTRVGSAGCQAREGSGQTLMARPRARPGPRAAIVTTNWSSVVPAPSPPEVQLDSLLAAVDEPGDRGSRSEDAWQARDLSPVAAVSCWMVAAYPIVYRSSPARRYLMPASRGVAPLRRAGRSRFFLVGSAIGPLPGFVILTTCLPLRTIVQPLELAQLLRRLLVENDHSTGAASAMPAAPAKARLRTATSCGRASRGVPLSSVVFSASARGREAPSRLTPDT